MMICGLILQSLSCSLLLSLPDGSGRREKYQQTEISRQPERRSKQSFLLTLKFSITYRRIPFDAYLLSLLMNKKRFILLPIF